MADEQAKRDANYNPALTGITDDANEEIRNLQVDTTTGRLKVDAFNDAGVNFGELSADPSNPDEGKAVIWMSDGTGTGDDGDILIKITAGGVTKTATLVDFSTV